jgi:hypothetical protein
MSYVLLDPDPARKRKRARKRRARTVRVIALDPEPARRLRRIGAKAKAFIKGQLSNIIVGFLGYKAFANYSWDINPGLSAKVLDFGKFSLQQNNVIGLAGATITPFLAGKKVKMRNALGGLVGGLLGYLFEVIKTVSKSGNPHSNPNSGGGGGFKVNGGFKPYEVV